MNTGLTIKMITYLSSRNVAQASGGGFPLRQRHPIGKADHTDRTSRTAGYSSPHSRELLRYNEGTLFLLKDNSETSHQKREQFSRRIWRGDQATQGAVSLNAGRSQSTHQTTSDPR